jgi:hypothetical protein
MIFKVRKVFSTFADIEIDALTEEDAISVAKEIDIPADHITDNIQDEECYIVRISSVYRPGE